MTLLGIRENITGNYLPNNVSQFEPVTTFDVPELKDMFSNTLKSSDLLMESFRKNNLPTNIEGFVIKDAHGNMIKIKWQWYVEAHHMAGNKTSNNSIERLANIWKTGESEEFFGYFPHMRDTYNKVAEVCSSRHDEIYRLYEKIVKLKRAKDNTTVGTSRKDIADWMKGYEECKIIWKYINKDLSISPINEDEVRDFVVKTLKKEDVK